MKDLSYWIFAFVSLTAFLTFKFWSGCGGLAKGPELAGFKHSALLEINHQACKSLRANYDPLIVHEVDVKKVDFRVFEGADVISGGPQCQPFSLGGLSKPDPSEALKYAEDHIFIGGAKIYSGHTGSDIDKPSKTIKAGAHGVPGGENMLRFRDGSVQYMTVHEAKLIQSFPRDYKITGSWGEV